MPLLMQHVFICVVVSLSTVLSSIDSGIQGILNVAPLLVMSSQIYEWLYYYYQRCTQFTEYVASIDYFYAYFILFLQPST